MYCTEMLNFAFFDKLETRAYRASAIERSIMHQRNMLELKKVLRVSTQQVA